MTTVLRSAIVPYSPEKLFALVDDIEAYPAFIPWCVDAKILHREANQVVATLTIGKAKLRYAFTTQNENCPPDYIVMHLKEGPFSHFEAKWQFKALSQTATQIEFYIAFQLNNKILDATFGSMLQHMANTLVKVFCERAKAIYGSSTL